MVGAGLVGRAQELAALLDRGAGAAPVVALVGDPGTGKTALLAAAARHDDGELVIVDDAHRPGGAELVACTVAEAGRRRLLVAVRPRQADAALLAALAGPGVRRVELGPLTAAEVRELAGADAATVYALTRGYPHLVQALLALPRPAWPEPDDVRDRLPDLPPSLSGPVLAELGSLDGPTLALAQGVAVAGVAAPVELVAAIDGRSEALVRAGLAELRRRDLVRVGPDGSVGLRDFLLRAAVYGSAPATWRRAAHARAASWPALPPERLGAHLERGLTPGDAAGVERLRAAAVTVRIAHPEAALAWLTAARSVATPEQAVELDHERAVVLAGLGDLAAACALLAEPAAESVERALLSSRLHRLLGRSARARAVLRAALDQTRAPAARAGLELQLASASRDVELPDPDGLPAELTAAVHAQRALRASLRGDVPVADAALAAAAVPGSVRLPPETLTWLGWAELYLDRYAAAAERFRLAHEAVDAGEQPWLRGEVLLGRASAASWLGDLDGAAAAAEQARAWAVRAGSDEIRSVASSRLAQASLWRGDVDAALRHARDAIAAAGTERAWWSDLAQAGLAQAWLAAGRPERAVEQFARRPSGAQVAPTVQAAWRAVRIEAELATGRGRWVELPPEADVDDRLTPAHQAFRALSAARVATAVGADGAMAAERAAGLFRSVGARILAGRAHELAAVAHHAAGRPEPARGHLAQAEELYRKCGCLGYLAGVQERRRALPATEDGPLTRLSERDRQIARLAAAGLGNRQIADGLHVSVKTVESRLTRIYAQLGVRSRVGLARLVAHADAG